MNSGLGLAARTLALDLAAGEVIGALDATGIEAIVLKGPAMVHRLYGDAPGRRNYGDIDVLVAPGRFDDAAQVLASLGFRDHLAGIRPSEAARLQGRPWHRDGAALVVVDLHRGFHHVADRAAWWELMRRHREVLLLEGQPVMIPDRIGCALIAALHASKAPSETKPLEDLRRALRLFSDEVWRQAAGLAGLVGAGDAFAAALCRDSAGAAARRPPRPDRDGSGRVVRGHVCHARHLFPDPGAGSGQLGRPGPAAAGPGVPVEGDPLRDQAHRRARPGRADRRAPLPGLHEYCPAPAGAAGLAPGLPPAAAPGSPGTRRPGRAPTSPHALGPGRGGRRNQLVDAPDVVAGPPAARRPPAGKRHAPIPRRAA